MRGLMTLLAALAVLAGPVPVRAGGTLHGPERISSAALGYELQYWIYLPDTPDRPLPELYLTDGEGYLEHVEVPRVLDAEIDSGRVLPLAAIFVDSRDPDDAGHTRRNQEFMCNARYAQFFAGELMPEISRRWTGARPETRRSLVGISFGAINAACFGMMLPGVFDPLFLHSPGSPEHIEVVRQLYADNPPHTASFVVTHGGRGDNGKATRKLVSTLEDRGYRVRYQVNPGGHDWRQWKFLFDDDLQVFLGRPEAGVEP